MTTIRWLKPDNMVDRDDEVVDDTGKTYLIVQFADFVKSHPFELLRDRGWLHIEKAGVELLLWDTDKWMPVQTAGIPEVKWVENVENKINLCDLHRLPQRLTNGCQIPAGGSEACHCGRDSLGGIQGSPRLDSSPLPVEGNSNHPDIPEAPTVDYNASGGKL